jgi:hypothetical protein
MLYVAMINVNVADSYSMQAMLSAITVSIADSKPAGNLVDS